MTPTLRRTNRILIVDEDPAALEMLQRYVRAQGWTVVAASSAEQALRGFSIGMFDCVLAADDLQDGMGAGELAATLRELDPELEIALMSWPVRGEDEEKEEKPAPELPAPLNWRDVDAWLGCTPIASARADC